jgi:hypothetical protein
MPKVAYKENIVDSKMYELADKNKNSVNSIQISGCYSAILVSFIAVCNSSWIGFSI